MSFRDILSLCFASFCLFQTGFCDANVRPVFKLSARHKMVEIGSFTANASLVAMLDHHNTTGLVCALLCIDDESCIGFNFNGRTDLHQRKHCQIVPKVKGKHYEKYLVKEKDMNFYHKGEKKFFINSLIYCC